MMITNFKYLVYPLSLIFILGSCGQIEDAEQGTPIQLSPPNDLPNIVYILADDLGYGDIGVYNPESKIATPNLDRLASQGIRFLDAHSPSSVCTPTRYGIMTGRYCWRTKLPRGVLRGYGRSLIEEEEITVAEFLKDAGFKTGVVGKWHLGLDWVVKSGHEEVLTGGDSDINDQGVVTEMNPDHIDFSQKPTNGPLDHGFDYSFILPASLDMPPYCYLENDRLVTMPTDSTPGNDLNTGYTEAFWRGGLMAPDFEFDQVLPTFTQKATEFIEDPASKQQPFFLYVPFAAPHTPWVPTETYRDTSKSGTYGDFVTMVDNAVGQILASIENAGFSDNTIVFFTSDNGPFWTPALTEQYGHRAAGPLRGMKADAWEGGHRVPFIAKWPGKIPGNMSTSATTSLTNLLATVSDIVDIPLPEGAGQDSYSILPVLMGQATHVEGQQAVIHHSSRGFFAIREGAYKLIEGRGSGGFSNPPIYEPKAGEPTGQLYNLRQDPKETQNLYNEKPEIVQALKQKLLTIKSQSNDEN